MVIFLYEFFKDLRSLRRSEKHRGCEDGSDGEDCGSRVVKLFEDAENIVVYEEEVA